MSCVGGQGFWSDGVQPETSDSEHATVLESGSSLQACKQKSSLCSTGWCQEQHFPQAAFLTWCQWGRLSRSDGWPDVAKLIQYNINFPGSWRKSGSCSATPRTMCQKSFLERGDHTPHMQAVQNPVSGLAVLQVNGPCPTL